MDSLIATDEHYVIMGLGKTGLSVARYLSRRGVRFSVVDTRMQPPALNELKALDETIPVFLGDDMKSSETRCLNATAIVLSPGLSRTEPLIEKALENNIPVTTDIALFLKEVSCPVIGITGSNGKTTVTTLVGEVFKAAGKKVCVAGNIGLPALDALEADLDFAILELSSFQLESLIKPELAVACVLNLSEDHMDRYNSMADYCRAKQNIFRGAKSVVYNLDDKLTQPPVVNGVSRFGFGLEKHVEEGEKKYLYSASNKTLDVDGKEVLEAAALKMFGRHNIANALAVLAISDAAGIPREAVYSTLVTFPGLKHRCQWVAEKNGVTFINDSKATNVGAAVAALSGLADEFTMMVLIVGGEGKNADFSDLANAVNRWVSVLVLIGRDADFIANQVDTHITKLTASSMSDAVNKAYAHCKNNGVVLLSPACASFDMFSGFEDRGEQFIQAVEALVA